MLVFFLVVAGLEVGLRAAGFGGEGGMISDQDGRLGLRILPNQEIDRHEGIRINAFGYRGPDWLTPEEDSERFRVAVIGNSVLFGSRTAYGDTITGMLEREVRSDFAARGIEREAEVMCFAVPSYAFEQLVRTYEEDARRFEPDVVVFSFQPFDVRPMVEGREPSPNPLRPFVLRSAIYNFLRTRVNATGFVLEPTTREVVIRAVGDPFGPDAVPLWERVEERLNEALAAVEAEGGRLALLFNPYLQASVSGTHHRFTDKLARWLADHPSAIAIDANDEVQAAMAPLMEELEHKGIAPSVFMDPAEWNALDLEHGEESVFYPADNFHLTRRGHGIVGRKAFAVLKAEGLF